MCCYTKISWYSIIADSRPKAQAYMKTIGWSKTSQTTWGHPGDGDMFTQCSILAAILNLKKQPPDRTHH